MPNLHRNAEAVAPQELPWRPREDSRGSVAAEALADFVGREPLTSGLGNCTGRGRGARSAFWARATWQSVANRVLAGPSGSYRRSNNLPRAHTGIEFERPGGGARSELAQGEGGPHGTDDGQALS